MFILKFRSDQVHTSVKSMIKLHQKTLVCIRSLHPGH